MKKRMVIAFFATSLTAGVSFAADWPVIGTQLYPSAPRMDRHLFWSQCRLRLGTGLIKYRFWRWSGKYRFANSGRRDDAIWTRCDRARRYEPA